MKTIIKIILDRIKFLGYHPIYESKEPDTNGCLAETKKKGNNMKLLNKIAIALVAAGSMATVCAESITFGVEIPPIASLIVRDGRITGANVLGNADPAAALPSASATVGGFTVVTNMPKWNLYFGLANDGNLISKSGTYLKSTSAATPYLALGGVAAGTAAPASGRVWLKFPTVGQIKGTDGGAATNLIIGTAAKFNLITTDGEITSAKNSLTAIMAATSVNTACTGACVNNGWVYGTDLTSASLDIGALISNTTPIIGLAGTYTETLYVTLVTAY